MPPSLRVLPTVMIGKGRSAACAAGILRLGVTFRMRMTGSGKTGSQAGTPAISEHGLSVFGTSIVSTLLVDTAYCVLECSRQAAELLCVDAAELNGVAMQRILAPASYARFTVLATQAAQHSHSLYDSLQFTTPGEPVEFEAELYAVQDRYFVLRLYAMSRAERRTQMLVRLNRQAACLLAAASSEDVQQCVAQALDGLDIGITIALLNSDGTHFNIMPARVQPADRHAPITIQGLAGFVPGETSIPIDSPLVADVAHQHSILRTANLAALLSRLELPGVAQALQAAGESIGRMGLIVAPLLIGDRLRGVLAAWGPGLSHSEMAVIEAVAHQVGSALEQIEYRQGTQQHIQKLAALAATSMAISQPGSLEDVLRLICEQAVLLLGAQQTALARMEPGGDTLAVVMTSGVEPRGEPPRLPANPGLQNLMRQPAGIVVDDAALHPEWQPIAMQLPGARSLALYGLRNGTHTLGLLVIGHSTPNRFSASDLEIMRRYAELVAVALANAETYRSLKQSAALQERQYAEAVETRNFATMVIENVPDALVICNQAMIMHPLNERPLRAVGFSRSDLEGRPLTDIVAIPYQSQINELWRQVQEAQLQRFETMLLRADGTSFHAWITAVRIPDTNDVLAIVTDITARHKLMQAEKMAALGRLVSGVAHELNNPLAVVLGLTQLQLLEDHPPLVRADLQGIESAVLRASAIVQQLRMFVHPSAPLARAVNLATLIQEAICEHDQRLHDLGVELHVDIADNLPLIEGDQALLRQAFINILDNALTSIERMLAAPEPRDPAIMIDVWQEPIAIALSISDTGTGIAPQHLSYIFEPFFTTLGVGQGLGLGLAIVYTIVQQHGGHIWAEHAGTHGATFQLRLPYTQSGTPSSEPPLFR